MTAGIASRGSYSGNVSAARGVVDDRFADGSLCQVGRFFADSWEVIASAELRALEERLTFVRLAAGGAAALAVGETSFPGFPAALAASGLVALLVVGGVTVWILARRVTAGESLRRLGAAAFSLDAVVVIGVAWLFSSHLGYLGLAPLVLVPLEAAFRYRGAGAALASGGVAMVVIPIGLRHAARLDEPVDVGSLVLICLSCALVAAIATIFSDGLRGRAEDVERHSRRLAEIDRFKDRFLAVTSHEIRGPLTAIITGVDTVWRRGARLNEEQRNRLLELVSGQAHQMARLVEDIMVTTHLQAGKLSLHPQWTELEVVVTQALESAASKRRSHRLEVLIEPVRAEIDAARLDQVVRNLVENAYKYTPEETRVSVEVKRTREGILLRIADEGPGIPVEQRTALFDAFSRIEQTSTGQEGVGLGLFVVSQIVAAMGGHIDLVSSRHGTAFTIRIPCPAEISRRDLGLVREEETRPSG